MRNSLFCLVPLLTLLVGCNVAPPSQEAVTASLRANPDIVIGALRKNPELVAQALSSTPLPQIVLRDEDGTETTITGRTLTRADATGKTRWVAGFASDTILGTFLFGANSDRRLYFDGLQGDAATVVFRTPGGDGLNLGYFEHPGMFGAGYVYNKERDSKMQEC